MRPRVWVSAVALISLMGAAGVGAAHASTITLNAAVQVTTVYDYGTNVTTTLPTPILFNLSLAFDDGVTGLSTRVGPPSWATDVNFGEPTGLESIPLTVPPPPAGWTSVGGSPVTLEEREFRTDSTPYVQLYDVIGDLRSYNYSTNSPHSYYLYGASLSYSVKDAGYTSPDFGIPTIGSFLTGMTQGGRFQLLGRLLERDGSRSGLVYSGTFEASVTRVPEPSGVLLLALGLGFWVKRRMVIHG